MKVREKFVTGREFIASKLAARSTVHADNGRLSRAARSMRLATQFTPSAAYRLFRLAELLHIQGRSKDARSVISKSLKTFTQTPPVEVLTCAGFIDCAVGDLAAAEQRLREAHDNYPDNYLAAYSLGSILCVQGKSAEADAMFAQDIPVMTGMGKHTSTRALCFGTPIAAATLVRRVTLLAADQAPQSTSVFFAAADSVYFCRYARHVVRSIAAATGLPATLHFHVVNPSAEALALAHELKDTGVQVSIETTDLSAFDEDQRKTYFSCARYLALPWIMELYTRPVIVMDMDQMVMSSPAPLLAFAQAHDVSLLKFDSGRSNVFSLISATLLVVAPTVEGKKFAQRLTDSLTFAIQNPSHMQWHLDQAALARAYLSMPAVRFGYIPASMLHLGAGEPKAKRRADEGIFWSITNSIESNLSKLETASFKRFSA